LVVAASPYGNVQSNDLPAVVVVEKDIGSSNGCTNNVDSSRGSQDDPHCLGIRDEHFLHIHGQINCYGLVESKFQQAGVCITTDQANFCDVRLDLQGTLRDDATVPQLSLRVVPPVSALAFSERSMHRLRASLR
jgi:hypothetical protein